MMSPFRLNVSNLGSNAGELGGGANSGGGGSNPKKRRKNVQSSLQSHQPPPPPPPNVQDLLPPPLTGYGDTIVASNPFDDCPSSVNTSGALRASNPGPPPPPTPMGMMVPPPPPNISMGVHQHNMNICRPIGPGMNMSGTSIMHSPNSHHLMSGGNPMIMNGPPAPPPPPQPQPVPQSRSMTGGHLTVGPTHMMQNPISGPIHPSIHSPIGNMGPGMSGPGPMPGPGPMGGMSPQMNMNAPNGPIGPPPPPPHHNSNFIMSPMNNMYSKPMPVSAGKIYPADQPMVFNSQNPNAPPIYPCGICHKEVHDNDQAILCESGCNFWFHRGCTGLTEAAFQLLTAEVYAEWVCDKCLATKNIPLVKFKP